MQSNSAESGVIRSYLDTCLGLPWHITTEDDLDQAHARRVLDREHYGLQKVKERILELLAVRKLNTEVKGQIVCLVGPPGVGKTSIAHSIADCMGRKFARMSLGGVHDEAEIRGHRRTYIGAMPGRIISAINAAKSCNPVILLDEIDKLGGDYKGDPSSSPAGGAGPRAEPHLPRITTSSMPVRFDARCSSSPPPTMPAHRFPARCCDRMEVIELPSYTRTEEKLQHCQAPSAAQAAEKQRPGRPRSPMTDGAICEIIDRLHPRGRRTSPGAAAWHLVCRESVPMKIADRRDEKSQRLRRRPGRVAARPPSRSSRPSSPAPTPCGIVNGLAWTSVGGEHAARRSERHAQRHRQDRSRPAAWAT